jgi:hypothetical protein
MTDRLTEHEISELKPGDLIYIWLPAYADLDLVEVEVININSTHVEIAEKIGDIYSHETIELKYLSRFSSRNTIEELCIKKQCQLLGKRPMDFRHLKQI